MATHETRHGVLAEQIKKCEVEQMELSKTMIDMHGSVTRSEGRMNNLEEAVMEIRKNMADMTEKQESLVSMVAQLFMGKQNGKEISNESSSSPGITKDGILSAPGNPQFNIIKPVEMNNMRLPKLDFPYFNGDGPREWIRKAQKYFCIHQVSDHLRVSIAEMYLQGKADIWYHSFAATHPHASWDVFTEAVCRRFTETLGGEVVEAFSKIKQRGGVTEYQDLFEELRAHVMLILPQAPENYYISVFTSGLTEEIKSMVKIMRPQSLAHAFEIAILQEASIQARSRNT